MINAVKQIHDKGIIHRDIKPANFFIGENDKLYLGDFGIATENYDGTYLIGTPLYMYFFLNYMIGFMEGNQNIVNSLLKHCDLYSLMCTIFELLQLTYFADYSGTFNVSYQTILYDKNFKLLCPKADFDVPNDIINKIIFLPIISNSFKCDGKSGSSQTSNLIAIVSCSVIFILIKVRIGILL